MASGGDHQCVAAHQGQGQLAKNLAGHLAFLQSLASRQACGQLLHLAHCSRVKAAKCFHREGQENQALEAASFSRFPGLPLAGFGKGSSWFSGSVSNIGGTEGASHCHINCHIFPIRPAPDCDITRACDGSWQEMLFFPAWPQVSTIGSLEQNISDHIMPGYPVRSCAATQRVISHAITW